MHAVSVLQAAHQREEEVIGSEDGIGHIGGDVSTSLR